MKFKNILAIALIGTTSFLLQASEVNITKCTGVANKESVTFVESGSVTEIVFNNKVLNCDIIEKNNASLTCVAIDFDTSGAYVLRLDSNKTGSLEVLPPPGSGEIELISLECR